jgi:uncharacterized membrane protein
MTKKTILIALLLIAVLLTNSAAVSAEELPVVRAILFYSPNCGHCHKVITQDLPPLFDNYGDQLLILYIDITTQGGNELFISTLEEMEYPLDQAGVPLMIIGETILVGSQQIPMELPGLIEAGLESGGIMWPPTPTMAEVLTAEGFIDPTTGAGITPTPDPEMAATLAAIQTQEAEEREDPTPTNEESTPTSSPTEPIKPTITLIPTNTATPSIVEGDGDSETSIFEEQPNLDNNRELNFNQFGERFAQDITANTIAVVVLAAMIGLVVWIGIQFMQANTPKMWPEYILPVLLVIGLIIAFYLATVEVSGNEAICGPVGDCNAVQQSKYSKLFGFLPVAVLGIIGYFLIGGAWQLARRVNNEKLKFYAKIAMFLFSLFGLLFFIYLTFLEPFVIGATCAWCLSSAIIFSLINLYATPVALNAWAEMEFELEDDYQE